MSTGLTALFSKFLSGGAKAFGMTFGSAMGQKAPKYDPGVKGLAQSFLATSSAKDDTSFSEVLAKMQGTTVNPTAASVMSGKTTPSVSVQNVGLVGMDNPAIATAMRQTFQRNSQIDPNLDRLVRELQSQGGTPQLNIKQGRITQRV